MWNETETFVMIEFLVEWKVEIGADVWEFSGTPSWNGMKIGSLLDVHVNVSYKRNSKVRCVPMTLENVLHTQNVCVWSLKKFLRASKVKVFTQNTHKMSEHSQAWQSCSRDKNFKKCALKSLFLQYKIFRWAYGHDSKFATFPWSRKMFYILTAYADNALKIFYGLLKSKSLPKPT